MGDIAMLGAIAGDVIGSVYEWQPIKATDFPLFHEHCRFTDDTVLTVALADSLLHGVPYAVLLKRYYRAYPRAGYGGMFHQGGQARGPPPPPHLGQGPAPRGRPRGVP